MEYFRSRQVEGDFDEVRDRLRGALDQEDLAVVYDVDLRAAFDDEFAAEGSEYHVFGVCTSMLAERAAGWDQELGTLVPLHVVVTESPLGDGVIVYTVRPRAILSVVDDPDIDAIAADVADRFERVLATVSFVR
jgi:uncharacterized protein (DUF302 family)